MTISDLRYLAAYLIPLACWIGLYFGGWLSPGILYLGFGIIPAIELFVPASKVNVPEDRLQKKSRLKIFDVLLYLNLPIVYGLVGYYIWLLANQEWTVGEHIGAVINVGALLGICGINVAHELGHRQEKFDRWIAKGLLLTVLYSHFTLEHNHGHHLHVGTPEDPATARKNEPIYTFFFRSVIGSYRNAWRIGWKMLDRAGKPWWQHELLVAHLFQIVFLAIVWYFTEWTGLGIYLATAVVGFLLLEAVNYIEHYGLLRKRMPSGRFEPMNDSHSWNSNHELGRIMLYELVRHSDHHYQTNRKYQALRHRDQSPQLPFGYPLSILLALIPPVWFAVMNPRLDTPSPA